MRKYLVGLCLMSGILFAQEFNVDLEVKGVKAGEGNVYMAIYNSKESYTKSLPFRGEASIAYNSTVNFELNLSTGDYIFTSFQDLNGNGQLDFTNKGIPIEPVGISNFDGLGNPMEFEKFKTTINSNKKVLINLK